MTEHAETETTTARRIGAPLLNHIVPRRSDGTLEGRALCGELWDRAETLGPEVCGECVREFESRGVPWFREVQP